MKRRKLSRFWRWLLRIVSSLLLAFMGLVAWSIWEESRPTPQNSLNEGLKYIQANDVYLNDASKRKLQAMIDSKPQARTDEQVAQKLRDTFKLIGDLHGYVSLPTDDPAQDALEYGSGVFIERGGYVLGYYADAPAEARQLHVGDQILTVDGATLDHLNDIAATLDTTKLHDYRINRSGQPLTLRLHHYRSQAYLQPVGRMLTTSTAYFLMTATEIPDLSDAEDQVAYREYVGRHAAALKQLKRPLCGLVVDLRLNYGGDAAPEALVASLFLGLGRYIYTSHPAFWIGVDQSGTGYMAGKPGQPNTYFDQISMPLPAQARVTGDHPWLALLTSSVTASSGEIITIAARTNPRTRTFGEATYGAVTGRFSRTLPNHMEIGFSTSFMTDVQGKVYDHPIQPDVYVKTNYSTFGSSRDPVVLKAQEWLKTKGCQ